MFNYVEKILKLLDVPVMYLKRPPIPKDKVVCLSFHFFNENGSLYGDGDEILTSGSLQLDFFGERPEEILKVREAAIGLFKAHNSKKTIMFMKSTPDEMSYENDVKLYHHVLVFNYHILDRKEIGNG